MEDQSSEALQRKFIALLNLFYIQHDHKYRFKPEIFNFMINTRDKTTIYLPKSVKYFKKIFKLKNSNIKLKLNAKKNLTDLKKNKQVQDENNVYNALQEATVLDRIFALKKKGIWTRDSLPKVMEPRRIICHWDYLLQEVEWMSADFTIRLKWKLGAARILAECAQEFVNNKEEIRKLEYIHNQQQGRLQCSIISKMVKEWWILKAKREHLLRTNIYNETSYDAGNIVKDYCQMWLSNSLINAEGKGKTYESLYDENDSDSLCSFSSEVNSIMLNDDDLILSCDEDEIGCIEDDNRAELIEELKWLEYDTDVSNNAEAKFMIDNEIDELNVLSKLPLEYLVDESYFLIDNTLNDTWSIHSDSIENESMYSQAALEENFISTNLISMQNAIFSNCCKLGTVLQSRNFRNMASTDYYDVEKYLKNYAIKDNIQMLTELFIEKITFSLSSNLKCGDDRFLITVLFGYLSQKAVYTGSTLIITTFSMISEWGKLFAKICPKINVVLLDSYISEPGTENILNKIHVNDSVFCIVSYNAIVKCSMLRSFNWNTIVYDQFGKYCQNLQVDADNSCLFDISCDRKIALISEVDDVLFDINSLSLYFKTLFSLNSYMCLLNELQERYSIQSTASRVLTDKLKKIVVKHVVPQTHDYYPEDSSHVIMCEFTPIQKSLHDFTIQKLKSSLDSSRFLDILESISQDIQISQHPSLFDYSSGDSDLNMYNSLLKENDVEHMDYQYTFSHLDAIEYYIPQLISCSFHESNTSKVIMQNIFLPKTMELEQIPDSHIFMSNENVDKIKDKENYITNSNITETIDNSTFLSPSDIKRLKSELDENGVNNNYYKHLQNTLDYHNLGDNITNETGYIAIKSSSVLCIGNMRQSRYVNRGVTFFRDTLLIDYNINFNELTLLQQLTSITKLRVDSMIRSFKVIGQKVSATFPKLKSKHGQLKLSVDPNLDNCITTFYRKYFHNIPKINERIYSIKDKKIFMSGKLKTLNQMFKAMAQDKNTHKYIIISHSFYFLDMIESMIFSKKNYSTFIRLRLNASVAEFDDRASSIVDYFNNATRRLKKVVLLVHSKCDSVILNEIDASSSCIIVTDNHWQTNSNIIIKQIISRWNLNCLISGKTTFSFYRLCSLGSLEQFFLSHDLSFIYDNCYINKHVSNSMSSSVICQQSLLKYFIDKLSSPLKEELISGFYVDDFQSSFQSNEDFVKLSHEAICEIFNTFENPYDLLQTCHYQSLKKMEYYDLGNCSETNYDGKFSIPKPLYFLNDNFEFEDSVLEETDHKLDFHNWELCRIHRSKELKDLKNVSENKGYLFFYDSKKMKPFDKTMVWMPPQVEENSMYVPHELKDMYEPVPIPNTDLSLHLLPTKLYHTKNNSHGIDEKNTVPSKMSEDTLTTNVNYDLERVKKRKFSSDGYPMGELNQYSLSLQKKRRILSNRRYVGEHDTDLHSSHSHLKPKLKFEKKNINERDITSIGSKESTEVTVKKQTFDDNDHTSIDGDVTLFQSVVSTALNIQNIAPSTTSDGNRFNSVIVSAGAGSIKVNLQRPFYSREGWKTLKSKRQHASSGNVSNSITKSSIVPPGNVQSYLGQQRLLYNRGQFSTKLGSQNDATSQSNSENEYEKLPDWNLHEEAVLYQNVTQYQDYQLSSQCSDKFSFGPNFKLCEKFLNFFSITNNHRSSEMCKVHLTKLQSGVSNQSNMSNILSRNNRNPILTNPMISGVAGRKLKIKMKNSIGTYGTSNLGTSQVTTSKIKTFQYLLNDTKVNLLQTNHIIKSSLNCFENMTSLTAEMLDEVVNKSRLPSLLPNHSQTIKKNATHINALEEHNIHKDKIFTPAMLIQRREDLDKERESESVHVTTNVNRQQIITPVSSNYRSPAYFSQDGVSLNSLSHIRRSASTNVGSSQNIYSIQSSSGNHVRPRYNFQNNRQMSGATVIHQSGVSQALNTISGLSNSTLANNSNSSTTSLSQNQIAPLGSRSQIQHFQIQQQSRNSIPTSRRPLNQPQVVSKLVPYSAGNGPNFHFLNKNSVVNRQPGTSFARPNVPSGITPSNSINVSGNNSIITVFPNSHEQSNLTMVGNNRSCERNTNIPMVTQPRGQGIRTTTPNIPSNRTNIIGTIPRIMPVQMSRSNVNNNSSSTGRKQD